MRRQALHAGLQGVNWCPRRTVCALAALALAAGTARADLAATAIALGADGVVAVTFDRAAAFAVHTLADPPRVVVDLPLTRWRVAPPAPQGGLAKAVRFGLAAPGASRLVIDLVGPARVAAARTPAAGGGSVLTLSLAPEGAAAFAARAAPPPGPHADGVTPAAAARGLTVAIDPGHGGADPGATHGALAEKDVTLAFAQALRGALAQRGHSATLTREVDVFLGLEERIGLARAAGADVLVSLHADAAPQSEVSGASVYTLSARASDADAAALASRETRAEAMLEAVFPGTESDIARVLAPTLRRETADASARLGAALLDALASAAPVLPGRPLRAAGFQVLRAPDIPAALIELGFMSNARDRSRLNDPAWIAAAADALAAGLGAWNDAARSHRAAE